MNRNVINVQFIKNGFKSHCWVCKQKFTLNGVEKEANFLAGVCGCNYEYEAYGKRQMQVNMICVQLLGNLMEHITGKMKDLLDWR
jgi:hypothetical protein